VIIKEKIEIRNRKKCVLHFILCGVFIGAKLYTGNDSQVKTILIN